MRPLLALAFALSILAPACGSSDSSPAPVGSSAGGAAGCTPGVTQACLCFDKREGVQACKDSGDSFTDCICGGGAGGQSAGQGGATGAGGGSAGSGGSGGDPFAGCGRDPSQDPGCHVGQAWHCPVDVTPPGCMHLMPEGSLTCCG